jgi:hypothetical protein
MPDFISEPAFEIGRRLEIRGPDSYAWVAVLKPAQDPDAALANFSVDLSAALDAPVRTVHAGDTSVEQLRAVLHAPADDPVLIADMDQHDVDYWRTVDVNRSGLVRRGPLVLWLSAEGLAELCVHAPNLRSFLGGSIFQLGTQGENMSEPERLRRIEELVSHYRLTSEEVVRRAELGTLPTEPQFVEWLVLLGRGDLV